MLKSAPRISENQSQSIIFFNLAISSVRNYLTVINQLQSYKINDPQGSQAPITITVSQFEHRTNFHESSIFKAQKKMKINTSNRHIAKF